MGLPYIICGLKLSVATLVLSYWLGWVMNEKKGDGTPVFAYDKIKEAYEAGRKLSENKEVL